MVSREKKIQQTNNKTNQKKNLLITAKAFEDYIKSNFY